MGEEADLGRGKSEKVPVEVAEQEMLRLALTRELESS